MKDGEKKLRTEAESRLKAIPDLGKTPTVEEIQHLVHELRVHQVELEMQNQELRETQEKLEISRDQYTNLFEFAPVGYFILDKHGLILNANLTGCSLLGIERGRLLKKPFSLYVARQLKEVGLFRNFLGAVLQSDLQQTIELPIKRNGNTIFAARLDVIAIKEEESQQAQCRLILSDITNEDQAKQQLTAILEAIEKERSRISADLHDSINPLLSICKLTIENCIEDTSKSRNDEKKAMNNVIDMLEQAITEIKTISYNLSPSILKDFGLVVALEDLCLKINQSEVLEVTLDIHISSRPHKKIELAIFRMTQELLNNVLKHAAAKQVEVQVILHKSSIVLVVSDNGKGFKMNDETVYNNGFGFRNIHSRVQTLNGRIDIDSTIGQGTTVVLEIPIV